MSPRISRLANTVSRFFYAASLLFGVAMVLLSVDGNLVAALFALFASISWLMSSLLARRVAVLSAWKFLVDVSRAYDDGD